MLKGTLRTTFHICDIFEKREAIFPLLFCLKENVSFQRLKDIFFFIQVSVMSTNTH